jgi:hypothetical protein
MIRLFLLAALLRAFVWWRELLKEVHQWSN